MKRALIIVDVQNDFLPGGALGVKGGDQIIPEINQLMNDYDLVVATQDWHPKDHGSFAASHFGQKVGEVVDLNGLPQVLWPIHCVQDSHGAELADGIDNKGIQFYIKKGRERGIDSYSAFYDNGKQKSTGLTDLLKKHHITAVTIVGLATDYCVRATALDAVGEGFETEVIADATRAVNLQPGDDEKAFLEMKQAGVKVV